MIVEMRPLASVKPYDNNPRHNEAAVGAVAASIREFGFRQPLVVDEYDVIIVGHTRYYAALELGLESVPVHVARDLTASQVKAYRIADNQTATLSSWDDDRLPQEILQLQGLDVDLTLTGFSAAELLRYVDPPVLEGATDPDAIPDPPEQAQTRGEQVVEHDLAGRRARRLAAIKAKWSSLRSTPRPPGSS